MRQPDLRERPALDRIATGHEEIEQHPDAVQVAFDARRLAFEELGRHVERRAGHARL
jgi:hypothetical protein